MYGRQVDAAADMIENLLVPTDEARNEHKRLQLRELAALNGTLKADQHCYLCGQSGHHQFECPNKPQDEIYKLPTEIQEKVDQLYQRDISRVAGGPLQLFPFAERPLISLWMLDGLA